MKDILLFDLDGTLTDPKEGITRCVQYALAHFGINVENLDELLCFIGPPLVESFKLFYGFNTDEAKQAVEKYRERFADIGIFENKVFDGIPELLKVCKQAGKTLCLATSKPEVFAVRILEKYDIAQYFDIVVGSTLDGSIDTKEEVILEVFRRIGKTESDKKKTYDNIKKENIIMIGDRKHDIIGAKKCGIESIGVRFGYAEAGELETAGADYIVSTVEELKKLCISI